MKKNILLLSLLSVASSWGADEFWTSATPSNKTNNTHQSVPEAFSLLQSFAQSNLALQGQAFLNKLASDKVLTIEQMDLLRDMLLYQAEEKELQRLDALILSYRGIQQSLTRLKEKTPNQPADFYLSQLSAEQLKALQQGIEYELFDRKQES